VPHGSDPPEAAPDTLRGVVADLDGVVTRTAVLHAEAWKQVLDELRDRRLARDGGDFTPFSIPDDYPELDGKPRLDGVRAFLRSRDLPVEEGTENDDVVAETVRGIGNRKNAVYRERLADEGARVFEDAVAWLRSARDSGVRLAVVSSSRNCALVVETAGLSDLFDVRVDGETLRELGLAGKPEPDLFAEAIRRLDLDPAEVIALEDAPAGVESARRAGCGLVVGIARDDDADPDRLRERGAHRVVRSLDELPGLRPTEGHDR